MYIIETLSVNHWRPLSVEVRCFMRVAITSISDCNLANNDSCSASLGLSTELTATGGSSERRRGGFSGFIDPSADRGVAEPRSSSDDKERRRVSLILSGSTGFGGGGGVSLLVESEVSLAKVRPSIDIGLATGGANLAFIADEEDGADGNLAGTRINDSFGLLVALVFVVPYFFTGLGGGLSTGAALAGG